MNIQLSVDWNSVSEVSSLSARLLRRKIVLQRGQQKQSMSARLEMKLNSLLFIYSTDISHLYTKRDETPKYYVYAHLDPDKPLDKANPIQEFSRRLGLEFLPFYIGKGVDDRCLDIKRNDSHRKVVTKIHAQGNQVIISKIKANLTETHALSTESKLIDIYGLLPFGGILTNLDEGEKVEERQKLYKQQLTVARMEISDLKKIYKDSKSRMERASLSEAGKISIFQSQTGYF